MYAEEAPRSRPVALLKSVGAEGENSAAFGSGTGDELAEKRVTEELVQPMLECDDDEGEG